MPSCSIKQCSARRTKNQPQLTIHRFPKREVNRQKWIDAIGIENINPRHNDLYVCSLHFEESDFNRTLDMIRLRDNAVPSLFLVPPTPKHMPFLPKENLEASGEMPSTSKHVPVLTAIDRNIIEQMPYLPKENLEASGEMPTISKHVPVLTTIDRNIYEHVPYLQKENLEASGEVPLTSKHVPVLTAIDRNIIEHAPYLPQENLEASDEMLSTSKYVSVWTETNRNIEKVMSQTKEDMALASELPSTSKHVPPVVPVVSEAKKDLVPHCEKVCRQSTKFQKLQKICDEQRKKIKRLNEKVRRQGKKIITLQDLIGDLNRKMIINKEQSFLLEQCGGSQDFLKRQIMKAKGLPLQKKYSEEIRKFALTLHFLSPKAYDFIRRVYNTCLPHPRTLSIWYQNVNAEAGFTTEAFETLKNKVEQSSPQKVLCSLVLDEISIRKGLTWDPKSSKYHGRVDYGHHIDCDSFDEASQALVFLLTCVNGSWKLPIGYFFIKSLNGEQKSHLVETAIKLTEQTGSQIVSVTCDGPATNFSMLSALGCKIDETQDRTSFETDSKNTIHAFIDPCHAIKLIRNTLGDLRVMIDAAGRKIDFKYLELLLQLQEQQGLHLGTKVSKAHIFFQKQKMKVRLATQLLSNSVADALLYCEKELQLEEFQGCEGTVSFINLMNNVFDVLNSHSIRPPGLKKAMCPENIGFIRALFESAIDYIRELRLPSGQLLVESRRKTGFVGLILDMKSALQMYEELVEKKCLLKYIPLYKISQDHLELFFSSIRARGGFNNNPNAVQFRAAYKRLLVRAEIRDGGIGNCIALEQINILTCSSKNPVESINNMTEKSRFLEVEEDHSDLYDSYMEAMSNATSPYEYSVLEYIAGFVCRKLSKTLKCETCLALLCGKSSVNSLTYLKSRGGLVYASADVINIIKKTEHLVKYHLDLKKNPEYYYMYIFKFMVDFYAFDSEKILSNKNTEHDTTHRILLIKSVIKVFIDLRYRYHGKKTTETLSCRNHFNKLILFRNE